MSFFQLMHYVFGYPERKFRRFLNSRTMKRVAEIDSLQDRFTLIYKKNAWGSRESLSGPGSTLLITERIRESLPILFQEFSIKSLFDAPCGDFNWMKLVDLKDIDYLGGDIVEPLVAELNRNYSSQSISFIHFDLTSTISPTVDLFLNRDCLFHFSYHDILRTLNNFLLSGSKYFLTTSHDDDEGIFFNSDVQSGGFRHLDLFSEPFCFPKDFHFAIPEPEENPPRKLYLWDREQVRVGQSNLESFLSGL